MTEEVYRPFYDALVERGYRLINSGAQYAEVTYFPNYYPKIRDGSPEAVWTDTPKAYLAWSLSCKLGDSSRAKRKEEKKGAIVTENEIAKVVVDVCYQIHVRLGPGLLESVYVRIVQYERNKRGLHVRREVPISFRYDEMEFDEGFRADLIVDDKVILELKSVENTSPIHKKQLLTYLKITQMRLGLLINFGVPLIKDGIFRLANGLPE